MYLPTWIFWTAGVMAWIGLIAIVGRSKSSFDFYSPLMGFAVFIIGVAFLIGYLVKV